MVRPEKVQAAFVKEILPAVRSDVHKGDQGHALIIGGSKGKIGSVCLAGKAALKSGCGLVTVYLPECGYGVVQTLVPEAMAETDSSPNMITNIHAKVAADAIGIGPGMGQAPQTAEALHRFLTCNQKPVVLDADALNIVSGDIDRFGTLLEGKVLTPHPKEFARLSGIAANNPEKLQSAAEFAAKHNCILVLKGSPTFVVLKEGIFENTTGNAALATAGSGDVLTGIITSFLAQGLEASHAAIAAVFIHGLTADIYTAKHSARSFVASDIIGNLGVALFALER